MKKNTFQIAFLFLFSLTAIFAGESKITQISNGLGNLPPKAQPQHAINKQLASFTIHFSDMTPHLGEKLFLRIVDKFNMQEVGRTEVASVTAAFDISLDVVSAGHSYFIDFFADHNNNGLYNAPPADHAWRMELNNATGNGDQINFVHNTNFTDIQWSYLLTVQFSNMNPHVGQPFELRVEDDLTGNEVGRKKIASINDPTFDITIPGIEIGKEYKVDFYADLNKNGLYDSPPVDHAWEMKFTNNSGDFNLLFSHNTNFQEINWKYLYTLNFSNMTPHLGEFFALRVVRKDTDEEIGRTSLPAVLDASFSLSIPQIEIGHDYNVDFYADHNSSGNYDAPPIDHAWRLTFNSTIGDVIDNFVHNTNFTDIQWPNTTDIQNESPTNPAEYILTQNYPNPFNPSTNIEFNINEASNVKIDIYDALGNYIETLLNEFKNTGNYKVTFNGENLSSGIYFYRITTNSNNTNLKLSQTKSMILLK